MVKNLPAMQETWVRSLGQEVPLEKEMATHSSILAWRIHGQRSLAGLLGGIHGIAESDTNEWLTLLPLLQINKAKPYFKSNSQQRSEKHCPGSRVKDAHILTVFSSSVCQLWMLGNVREESEFCSFQASWCLKFSGSQENIF